MTRSALWIPLLAMLVVGCTKKNHKVPAGMNQPMAKIDYTILGKTNHEECGTYILAIDWAHLFSNQAYTDGEPLPIKLVASSNGLRFERVPRFNADASRALYHAADKMPEATHLVAPRSHTTSSGVLLPGGWPLFGERCASVEAHGLVVGTGPAIHNAPLGGGTGGPAPMVPVLDEAGNPVLDEAGNPLMGPAAPVEGAEGEGTEVEGAEVVPPTP